MAFDDTKTEPLAMAALVAVALALAAPGYQRITAACTAHGVELTPLGHLGVSVLAALAGILALALLVLFGWWAAGVLRGLVVAISRFRKGGGPKEGDA